jgi:DUF4097 and DUF4098 domain-containing protein YvlB
MPKWFCLFWVAAAAGLAQTPSAVRQEGGWWVQSVAGVLKTASGGALEVETLGPVTLRGGAHRQVSYTLRKRVKASSEEEARKRLNEVVLKTVSAPVSRIQVQGPLRRPPSVELEIAAPSGLSRCLVRTRWGDVDVSGVDGRLEVATAAGAVKADRIGRGLVARSGGGDIEIGSVDGPVHAASAGGAVRVGRAAGETRIETGGGELEAREVGGRLIAITTGGNITAGSVAGGVTAQTAGGSIGIGRAGGPVVAQTSGGAITVGSAQDVRCESTAGAIRLRGVSGALRASTSAGSIFAELAAARLADSILSTSGGDVMVWIPSNVAVTVRAQNESSGRSAKIVSEFPEISVRPAAIHLSVAEGSLNGGGPLLTISTSNGDIYLRRQK